MGLKTMLNPFAGKTLEELEIIRKSKSNKAQRVLSDITMIDKEIEERRLKRNVTDFFKTITGRSEDYLE